MVWHEFKIANAAEDSKPEELRRFLEEDPKAFLAATDVSRVQRARSMGLNDWWVAARWA